VVDAEHIGSVTDRRSATCWVRAGVIALPPTALCDDLQLLAIVGAGSDSVGIGIKGFTA
jgi:hypothetical protein